VAPDTATAIKALTAFAGDPEKRQKKKHYVARQRQLHWIPNSNSIIRDPQNNAATRAADTLEDWAQKNDIAAGETKVLMSYLGSLGKIVTASDRELESVPVSKHTKRTLHSFFGSEGDTGGEYMRGGPIRNDSLGGIPPVIVTDRRSSYPQSQRMPVETTPVSSLGFGESTPPHPQRDDSTVNRSNLMRQEMACGSARPAVGASGISRPISSLGGFARSSRMARPSAMAPASSGMHYETSAVNPYPSSQQPYSSSYQQQPNSGRSGIARFQNSRPGFSRGHEGIFSRHQNQYQYQHQNPHQHQHHQSMTGQNIGMPYSSAPINFGQPTNAGYGDVGGMPQHPARFQQPMATHNNPNSSMVYGQQGNPRFPGLQPRPHHHQQQQSMAADNYNLAYASDPVPPTAADPRFPRLQQQQQYHQHTQQQQQQSWPPIQPNTTTGLPFRAIGDLGFYH
jgi:hypothetical protein